MLRISEVIAMGIERVSRAGSTDAPAHGCILFATECGSLEGKPLSGTESGRVRISFEQPMIERFHFAVSPDAVIDDTLREWALWLRIDL